jgi:hypothetical protein
MLLVPYFCLSELEQKKQIQNTQLVSRIASELYTKFPQIEHIVKLSLNVTDSLSTQLYLLFAERGNHLDLGVYVTQLNEQYPNITVIIRNQNLSHFFKENGLFSKFEIMSNEGIPNALHDLRKSVLREFGNHMHNVAVSYRDDCSRGCMRVLNDAVISYFVPKNGASSSFISTLGSLEPIMNTKYNWILGDIFIEPVRGALTERLNAHVNSNPREFIQFY